jgi:hypothetical protein
LPCVLGLTGMGIDQRSGVMSCFQMVEDLLFDGVKVCCWSRWRSDRGFRWGWGGREMEGR